MVDGEWLETNFSLLDGKLHINKNTGVNNILLNKIGDIDMDFF